MRLTFLGEIAEVDFTLNRLKQPDFQKRRWVLILEELLWLFQAIISFITLPCTSVRRWLRPWKA